MRMLHDSLELWKIIAVSVNIDDVEQFIIFWVCIKECAKLFWIRSVSGHKWLQRSINLIQKRKTWKIHAEI